jgi:formylglycine-generating enzyme required for sulfatase activity/tRNA A-37 threonylcarbamoyl transferase component Bud32
VTLTTDHVLVQRYRILRPLGEGGMGAAYLVEDQRLHRNCVIKEILIPDTTRRGQFEYEAQLLADLHHPHLPVVYDYFQEGARPYLVMEYVEGQTLDRLRDTRTTPFEVHDVLTWARDLLNALDYIHTRHPAIIHRDIKPQNVCIKPQGNAVLLDFGIARRLDDTHTQTAARAFTQGYAPIEQYPEEQLHHTEKPRRYVESLHAEGIHTGPYSDIYSLGATLYYALTLMPPPDACMRVLDDELHPVQEINKTVPEFLATAVMRALTLDPRQRFQSTDEMLSALQSQPETAGILLRLRRPRPLPTGNVAALDQPLVHIPTGHFNMGSDDTELKDACRPQHLVNLGAYCIGRYPVTHADYQRYIEANPSALVPYSPLRSAQRYNWDRRTRTYPRGLDDHPVVLVTWEEARAYCRWLSDVTGYRCRLPYETEWEKAACWDAAVGHARVYPWGDTFNENRCNVDAHGALQLISSAVGSYSPAGDSPYGLADMAGNVWEWTGSLYRPYPYSTADGREDPEATGERTIRGGAYDEGPLIARSAWRIGVPPERRLSNIGFRVVCEAKDR